MTKTEEKMKVIKYVSIQSNEFRKGWNACMKDKNSALTFSRPTYDFDWGFSECYDYLTEGTLPKRIK
jgi:hypothetical protein